MSAIIFLTACAPTDPVSFFTGSGGAEFEHGQSELAVPQPGAPLPPPGAYTSGASYDLAEAPSGQSTVTQGQSVTQVFEGQASWYGPGFEGRPTASGEIFNPSAFTAAHQSLPLPTNVRVTNIDNGQSVMVRVNDRMGNGTGRIIDVSQAAAERLGFLNQGLAQVRVEVLANTTQVPPAVSTAPLPPNPVTSTNNNSVSQANASATVVSSTSSGAAPNSSTPLIHGGFWVQAGVFAQADNLSRAQSSLTGIAPIVLERVALSDAITATRVRLGPFNNLNDARSVLAAVRQVGFEDALIQQR